MKLRLCIPINGRTDVIFGTNTLLEDVFILNPNQRDTKHSNKKSQPPASQRHKNYIKLHLPGSLQRQFNGCNFCIVEKEGKLKESFELHHCSYCYGL
jgi:hypothetical protein